MTETTVFKSRLSKLEKYNWPLKLALGSWRL